MKSSHRLRNVAEKAKKPRQPKLNAEQNHKVPCAFMLFSGAAAKHFISTESAARPCIDVKFGTSGIKRWITKYLFDLYRCPGCKARVPQP